MRRRLLIILISLLAGAFVNIAVAWGCATWSPFEPKGIADPAQSPVSPPDFVGLGFEITFVDNRNGMSCLDMTSGWPLLTLRQRSWQQFQLVAPLDEIRSRIQALTRRAENPIKPEMRARIRDGIVKLQLKARFHGTLAPAVRTPRRVLLTTPLWPGFAVNTLFYAPIPWLLICGAFALRRFLRQRRGLCPACAYPMGESAVCTECGRELPHRARPAT
jgi:hypothetical protein